jgi:hypothetical protein
MIASALSHPPGVRAILSVQHPDHQTVLAVGAALLALGGPSWAQLSAPIWFRVKGKAAHTEACP